MSKDFNQKKPTPPSGGGHGNGGRKSLRAHYTVGGKEAVGKGFINPNTGREMEPIDVTEFITALIKLAERIVESNGYPLDINRVTVVCMDILSSSDPASPFNKSMMDALYSGMYHHGYEPTQADIDNVSQQLAEAMGIPVESVDATVEVLEKFGRNQGTGDSLFNDLLTRMVEDAKRKKKDVDGGDGAGSDGEVGGEDANG